MGLVTLGRLLGFLRARSPCWGKGSRARAGGCLGRTCETPVLQRAAVPLGLPAPAGMPRDSGKRLASGTCLQGATHAPQSQQWGAREARCGLSAVRVPPAPGPTLWRLRGPRLSTGRTIQGEKLPRGSAAKGCRFSLGIRRGTLVSLRPALRVLRLGPLVGLRGAPRVPGCSWSAR